MLPNGKIKWQGAEEEFGTPSAWATHCKRLVNPIKRSGCGWASVSCFLCAVPACLGHGDEMSGICGCCIIFFFFFFFFFHPLVVVRLQHFEDSVTVTGFKACKIFAPPQFFGPLPPPPLPLSSPHYPPLSFSLRMTNMTGMKDQVPGTQCQILSCK